MCDGVFLSEMEVASLTETAWVSSNNKPAFPMNYRSNYFILDRTTQNGRIETHQTVTLKGV